jgi:transposase
MTQRKATPGSILDDLMSAAPAVAVKPAASTLRIAEIRRDGGTQPRAGLDETHVADLVAALANGDELPPVDVVFDGSTYWLYDGYHRTEAHSRSGKYTVQAIIHQGTQQDAQWQSYAANSRHGLKRTNDDKRRQVLAALRHANAASLSNVQIAKHVGVDEGTVRNYRAQMEVTSEIPKSQTRTGADGRTINTANIGTNQPAAQTYLEVWKLEQQANQLAKEWDMDPAMMREGARQQLGSYWGELTRRVNQVGQYRNSDLKQAINNVASQIEAKPKPPVGKPMIEVIKTADELAAEAEAADIASRNAAADEAERQAAEAARQAERDVKAIAITDVAFGRQTTRHTHLLHVLEQAMEALPEIGDAIGQRQFCLSVVVTLETMQKELLRKMAKAYETPAPPPAAPATELPVDLVAAGWQLVQRRTRWVAQVSVPTEDEPIETQLRTKVEDCVADAVYMHKALKIGAAA